MSYRQHLLDCIKTEIETCKHLYSKVAPEHLHFRPKDNIRSLEELLRYLSWVALEPVALFTGAPGESGGDLRALFVKRGEQLALEHFAEAMDEQMEEIARLFERITDDDLHTTMVVYPWRARAPLGEALMEMSVKRLAAYKMQLFLTIKMAGGNDELSTLDCWIRPYMHIGQLSGEAVAE